jgi:SAM-dependent methyltransferase
MVQKGIRRWRRQDVGGHLLSEISLNYEYVLRRALSSTEVRNPRILDYGSGQGQLIELALNRHVDIYGVDVPGIETSERVRLIVEGRIPFADNSFDVVVSNQVFEHILDPRPVLVEIHRVLKPGGAFIALFPDNTVWFEGHVGLYFVHWLTGFSGVSQLYLVLCHKIGLGYFRGEQGSRAWAQWVRHLMATEVFYHRPQDLERWWSETFGGQPESLADDWMRFRIAASKKLRWLMPIANTPWFSRMLASICRIRAGLVLRIHKSVEEPA